MSHLLLYGNTNQYNINGLLCTYTEMFRIQTCCNHILSAAEGFRGQGKHARIQEFLSVLFSPYLTVYRGGPMVLLLRKLYLYFTKDPNGVHYLPQGGGCQTFSRGGGPNASFFRTPYTCLLFSRGGVSEPPIPLWIRTKAMSS